LTPGTPNVLTLNVTSPTSPYAEPGDYPVSVTATSGDLKATANLTITVTARYGLEFKPVGSNPNYSLDVTPGRTTSFPAVLNNTGTSEITDISFSLDKPNEWQIEFPENVIDSIAAGSTHSLDIKFTLPADTISGDYMITLTAEGDQITAEPLQIRINVHTSSVWAWVGVMILVIVVLGLAFLFARFSRR